MKTAAIIQARTASTRFPGKVLFPLDGCKALTHLLSRLSSIPILDKIIIATPEGDSDIIDYCIENDTSYFEGNPENVRKRVLDCAVQNDVDTIVDITADCPLVDPYHIDNLVRLVNLYRYDYVSNIDPRTWPDGFDVQVYPTSVLQMVHKIDPEAAHVGWQILNLLYKGEIYLNTFNLPAPPQFTCPEMRLTLDTSEDARVLDQVFKDLGTYAPAIEIVAYMLAQPELQKINKNIRTKKPEEG